MYEGSTQTFCGAFSCALLERLVGSSQVGPSVQQGFCTLPHDSQLDYWDYKLTSVRNLKFNFFFLKSSPDLKLLLLSRCGRQHSANLLKVNF